MSRVRSEHCSPCAGCSRCCTGARTPAPANPAIPIELLENSCHDRLVQRSNVTEQGILSPKQLAAEVRRLTATPAEWVARVRLDPEGRWYERIHTTDGYEVWLISWLPGQSTGVHDHGGSAGAAGGEGGALRRGVVRGGGRTAVAGDRAARRV